MRRKRFCLGSHVSLWLCLLGVAMGPALLGGCGGSGRVAIEGAVPLDGKPLENGRVRFYPQPGTASPSAGAKITDGQFSVGPEDGLLPGKFRVEITAMRPTDRKVPDRFTGKMITLKEQYLPEKYNKRTQLKMTVPPEGGTVTKDFELNNAG